jgi:REP element-mobilizing transposase RayT
VFIENPNIGVWAPEEPPKPSGTVANTFSQIYLQFVFAVKNRQSLITKQHKEELHKYITGLVQKRQAKMLAIHCMPDHIHFFVGFKPTILICDFIKEIKVESNEFINSKKWVQGKFGWQEGYGVFSYSHSHIDRLIKYILNQESHHRKRIFRQEYRELLRKFEIPFEEKYLFEFFD